MKSLEIEVPNGYVIDKDVSTFEKIVFKLAKPKGLTWEEIQEMNHIEGIGQFHVGVYSSIQSSIAGNNEVFHNCIPTELEAKRMLAFCQCLVVAEYYRRRTFEEDGVKYYIHWGKGGSLEVIQTLDNFSHFLPYFNAKSDALEAYEANKEIFDTYLKINQ